MGRYIFSTLLGLFLFCAYCSHGQSRWQRVYLDEIDAPGDRILETYDRGVFLLGKYGHSYPKYLWLLKTDINGNIIWEKTLGNGANTMVFSDITQDNSGSTYMSGSTNNIDPNGDPIVMKLDACGNKSWCKIFHTPNNHDLSLGLTLTQDEDIAVVLNYTNPEPFTDRICLAKLSKDGYLEWKQCYTSSDTSQRSESTYNIITTPDSGFLITGFCYYEDPTWPNRWWPHPYFLKVDSIGNFEWETVVYKETHLHGGAAWSTVISPDSLYYYSSISHYFYDEDLASPALVKMDLMGNVIDVYDVVSGYKEGKLRFANFINDSTLAASAGWGNSSDSLFSWAVIIDTLGTLLNSRVLMEDLYTSLLQLTFDGKLLYGTDTYQNGQFDFYLTKLNQNMENDSIYTYPFIYDSLCPYLITGDTISQDDCGLIVGLEEIVRESVQEQDRIVVYPNPVVSAVSYQLSVIGSDDGFGGMSVVEVWDLYGRKVEAIEVPPGQTELKSDVTAWPAGVYIAIWRSEREIIARRKFVVAR